MNAFRRFLKWFFLNDGRHIRNPFEAAALVGGRMTLAFLAIGAIGGYTSEEWRAISIAVGSFMALGFAVFGIPPVRRWIKRAYMGVDERE